MTETKSHDYLPAMGKSWLLFLYEPLTRLWGVPKVRAELLDRANIEPGHRVLEIGCGPGDLLLAQAARASGVHLMGIDPDPAALRRAKRKARRARAEIKFERAYARSLPVPDRSVDRVLSSLMIHHLDPAETASAVAEIRRVLRPGGEVHILDIAGLPEGHRAGRKHPYLVGDLPGRVLAALRDGGLTDVAENGRGHARFGDYVLYRARA
ncbi:class I SAM-dependent methyltransferase [Actinoplanes sp. NPDC051861]|uniref:class I SAM-dependent methyltransferase n=1 Tax=Actinoplanes sp. NPDC051861 TaxID=3155170 RepID=UPI00342EAE1B